MTTTSNYPDFDEYFNLADEIWGGLALDDLDEDSIARAKRASDDLGLPWPPYLPAAEEMQLDRIERSRRG